MGKGRPRAVEKGGLGHSVAGGPGVSNASSSSGCSGGVPQAPVFYPTEEEFKQPLEYIDKIRPQAEPFGICRIVPPKSWNPPFALDRDAFAFPTKSQEIHLLQARPASCDPKTFYLDYGRFLESHLGRKSRRRVVFEDDDLDLCGLFNAVKRYGGYDKVCDEKRWREVAQFVRPAAKISECAKHVLCQLYREHLYDYEEHCKKISRGANKNKRGRQREDKKGSRHVESSVRKRRRKNTCPERVKEVVMEAYDQICEQCKSGLHGDVMLLCDRCDRGWHLYCLSPPLENIPSGNWYCSECMNSDKDAFGFMSGKLCTIEQFRRIDDRTRRKWFGQVNVSPVQMEKQFWEIVEGKSGEVEVMYGSDLDTSLYGSGFPRIHDPILSSVDPNVWKQYASNPWNLNNLPKLRGSMLHAVHENIAGVMVPWLYIGMLFSSFCWHVEDHCFYSINYLHWGAPKCWYGVPGSEANAFEKVMRNALPDLFEAQPDLLFQLVTMLDPSILQNNGVPVYSVLQEQGNFVITFPRSFHAGFNFGLNCAEAVNFAPADWLPHGRVGAELYQLYHKAPVICHEELICVTSKNGGDVRTLPYLKGEMQKVFDKEKKSREELWVNGIIRCSQMVPKKYPNYVGTEEDPTCLICQQHLYLSAIKCSCRPSAFVCLEHWRHLCECSPEKYHLLYRHNLAELRDLIHMLSPATEATGAIESSHTSKHSLLDRNKSSSMTKKVKGADISYAQLAEDWLSNACHIFEAPFSGSACANALKEAEQFLWAGHDMDTVRDMVTKLVEFQRWTLDLHSCQSKIDDYMQKRSNEKVPLCELEQLLRFCPLRCDEPALTRLKAYAEDAQKLSMKTESALSSSLSIVDLEDLYSRVSEFPIDLAKIDMLASEISSAKAWLNATRMCITEKKPEAIHIDVLNNLKLEMLKLHVHLPEMDLLSKLSLDVESWQIRCEELLKSPIKLKELEVFLQGTESLTVSIPGINLLRRYRSDAHSWICSIHNDFQKLKERDDHDNIVRELYNLLKAGESLKVQVDELPLVEAELKRSICRERASKALNARTPLTIIEEILMEASRLQIENEQLFEDISKLAGRAISWEEKAKSILEHGARLFEFDDIIRDSDDILVILPSLMTIKNAMSLAKSWISKSQPYLEHAMHLDSYAPLLKVSDLKDLINESKLLRVTLDTPQKLQSIVREVEAWEHNACCFLENLKSFINMHYADFLEDNHLSSKIEELLNEVNSTLKAGQSLHFEFRDFPQLSNASFFLKCCLRALSFCDRIPLREEVDSLLGEMDQLPVVFSGSLLAEVLISGTNWLRKAQLVFPEVLNPERSKLTDVQHILDDVQKINIPYPMMVTQLQRAIEKHKSWMKEVQVYFSSCVQQSWPALLRLKERGETDAFECEELDKVVSEIGKIEDWMSDCFTSLELLVGESGSLSDELVKIKSSLDRALSIYHSFEGRRERTFCVCCPGDPGKQVYTCHTCEDRYHASCVGPPLFNDGTTNENSCPFCHCIESGSITRNGGQALIHKGNRPEVNSFCKLLFAGEGLCKGINELKLVEEIVNKIKECKSYLTKIVNDVNSHCDTDLSSISDTLLIALKAMSVTAVYDDQDLCNLQSALSKISWKIRVKKLLGDSKKPVVQQIHHLIKEKEGYVKVLLETQKMVENDAHFASLICIMRCSLSLQGEAMSIPSEDYFMKEIIGVMRISLCWNEIAKKVSFDSGELALSEVYKLIIEGQNLPIHLEKELKLLKARSELYCICRKPYDHRAMIACDQCDEWYHFDCINLHGPPPKVFHCPACKPADGELITLPCTTYHDDRSINDGGPQTPPSCSSASREKQRVLGCIAADNLEDGFDLLNILRASSNIDHLWRKSKKPFQRTAKRRNKLEDLFCYFRSQVTNQ